MGNLLNEIKQKEMSSGGENRRNSVIQAMISDSMSKEVVLAEKEDIVKENKRGRPKVTDRKIKDKKITILINSDEYEEFREVIEEDNLKNDTSSSVNDTVCRLIRKYVKEHKI